MNETAIEHRNGVDVGRLKETIAHVRSDPSLARFRFRVDADAPRDAIEDPCAYVQRTSPVLDMSTNTVDVHVALEG